MRMGEYRSVSHRILRGRVLPIRAPVILEGARHRPPGHELRQGAKGQPQGSGEP